MDCSSVTQGSISQTAISPTLETIMLLSQLMIIRPEHGYAPVTIAVLQSNELNGSLE